MEFSAVAALGALIIAVINFLKYLFAKDRNGVVTQLTVWIAGVTSVLLAAQTDFASGINVGDQKLATLNFASQVFVGLSISSIASFAVELKKAIDTADSAVKPDLVKGDG